MDRLLKTRLVLGVLVPALNISMSGIPLYVSHTCYITAMYACESGSVPTYVSLFESLTMFYAPLFIASVLVLVVNLAQLLGYLDPDSVATTLASVALVPPSASFSLFYSQLPTTITFQSYVGWRTVIHAEIVLERTPLGYYAMWGPLATSIVLTVCTAWARRRARRLKGLQVNENPAVPARQVKSQF